MSFRERGSVCGGGGILADPGPARKTGAFRHPQLSRRDYHDLPSTTGHHIAMFETAIAGSLPKPSWLAEQNKLWPQWKLSGEELAEAKNDATLLWVKSQEDAGIDIVGDGEQARQHFVHGFLESVEGIDFEHKVKMGIRNNRYDAMVPTVVGPVRLRGRVHEPETKLARAHTKRKLKITMPGPMTIVDTIADRHYGDKVTMAMAFADLLNQEARALEAQGVDIIQFDEPAFNVYMDDVAKWGVDALHRAIEGLRCKTAVHICYGYGIKANIDWKNSLGSEWRQYEEFLPALAKSRLDQVSVECIHSRVPMNLLKLLEGKDVMIGVIDVASDRIETPEEIAGVIAEAMKYLPKESLRPCTNCGMAPMHRDIALAKLSALGAGAALARERFG
jgi:5-methyltetrahydropteroyltriglutamate--homocysteine methyltransferase